MAGNCNEEGTIEPIGGALALGGLTVDPNNAFHISYHRATNDLFRLAFHPEGGSCTNPAQAALQDWRTRFEAATGCGLNTIRTVATPLIATPIRLTSPLVPLSAALLGGLPGIDRVWQPRFRILKDPDGIPSCDLLSNSLTDAWVLATALRALCDRIAAEWLAASAPVLGDLESIRLTFVPTPLTAHERMAANRRLAEWAAATPTTPTPTHPA